MTFFFPPECKNMVIGGVTHVVEMHDASAAVFLPTDTSQIGKLPPSGSLIRGTDVVYQNLK